VLKQVGERGRKKAVCLPPRQGKEGNKPKSSLSLSLRKVKRLTLNREKKDHKSIVNTGGKWGVPGNMQNGKNRNRVDGRVGRAYYQLRAALNWTVEKGGRRRMERGDG